MKGPVTERNRYADSAVVHKLLNISSMQPLDPSGLIGLILGGLGVLGLEPTVRDWSRRFKSRRTERARQRRAKGAKQDYFYATYEYAVRLIDHGTEALSIRKVCVVPLTPALSEVKVRVSPSTGREIQATLLGTGVSLIEAPTDEAVRDARVYLVRFDPPIPVGKPISYELRTHTLVYDDSNTQQGTNRISWSSAGRRADRATMRVVLPYLPKQAWFKEFDAQGGVVGETIQLLADPLTFELRHDFVDVDPTHRFAISWELGDKTA